VKENNKTSDLELQAEGQHTISNEETNKKRFYLLFVVLTFWHILFVLLFFSLIFVVII